MRVVVTGASGSVGTAMLRTVPDAGWSVGGLARRRPESGQSPYDAADWCTCDVGDSTAVELLAKAFDGADAVVHLAWAIQPLAGDPPRSRTNVQGSRHVLEAVVRAGVRHLVCGSSSAVYARAPRWTYVDERWPRTGLPGSGYSQDKAALERLLDEFASRHRGITVAVVRPAGVVQRDAGAEIARWTMSRLLPSGMVGRRWLPFPLWRGLRAQVVHADDVARAIWRIVTMGAVGGYNLAASPVLTHRDLGTILGGFPVAVPRRLLAAAAWPTWRVGLQPVHPGWLAMADRACLVTTTRAQHDLGWDPAYDATAALAEFVDGVRLGAGTASPPLRPESGHGLRDRLRSVRWGRPSHQGA
jgi:UDP-glucose 4-epimerase